MKKNNFFIDLIIRLGSKNPKFFRYIQYVSIGIAAVTSIPELLEFLGIPIAGNLLILQNKTLTICAILSAIIAQLPNETPVAATLDEVEGDSDPSKPRETKPL